MDRNYTIDDYKKYVRELKIKLKKLNDKNQKMLFELNNINSQNDNNYKSKMIDFSFKFSKKVILIQSWIRGKIERTKFRKNLKDLNNTKLRTLKKNTNETIIKSIYKSVLKLGLNMEMWFRSADKHYKKKIKIDDFKWFFKSLNLKIQESYILKFLYILDEDCSGIITNFEYKNLLAAYQIESEDWSDGYTSRSFEVECLIKFVIFLDKKNINQENLYSILCNPDENTIKISLFLKFINDNLAHDLQEKEIYSIVNYLDKNKLKFIDVEFFKNEINKIYNIVNKNPNIINELYIINGENKLSPTNELQEYKNKNSENIIIKKKNIPLDQIWIKIINSINLVGFLYYNKSDLLQITVELLYNYIKEKEVKNWIENFQNEINIVEFKNKLYKEFCSNNINFSEFYLNLIGKNLDYQNISTYWFFTDKNISIDDELNVDSFNNLFKSVLDPISMLNLGDLYNFFNINQKSKIKVKHIISLINKNRENKDKNSVKPKKSFNNYSNNDYGIIVSKIFEKGIKYFNKFIINLLKNTDDFNEGIDINQVKDEFIESYCDILNENEINYFVEEIDKNNNKLVEITEILDVLKNGLSDNDEIVYLHLNIIGLYLEKEQVDTKFFLKKDNILKTKIDENNFSEFSNKYLFSNNEDSKILFNFISKNNKIIDINDILKVLDNFRKSKISKPTDNTVKDNTNINTSLKKVTKNSENFEKIMQITNQIYEILNKKGKKPHEVFNNLLKNNNQKISLISIKNDLKKYCNELNLNDLSYFMNFIDFHKNGHVDNNEFLVCFLFKNKDMNYLENGYSTEIDDEVFNIIKSFKNKFINSNINFIEVLKSLDKDGDGVISSLKLLKRLNEVSEKIDIIEFKNFIKILDTELNGFILKEDFELMLSIDKEGKVSKELEIFKFSEILEEFSGMKNINFKNFLLELKKLEKINVIEINFVLKKLIGNDNLLLVYKILVFFSNVYQNEDIDFKEIKLIFEGVKDIELLPKEDKEIIEDQKSNNIDLENNSIIKFLNYLEKKINIGNSLEEIFGDLDKNDDNNLNYWEFSQGIEEIGCTELTQEEKLSLFKLIDTENSHSIEINELKEFIIKKNNELELNFQINKKVSNKNIKVDNINDFNDYLKHINLTDEDYYLGKTTILNSYTAALKKAQLIVNNLIKKGKKLFKDTNFGPNKDDINGKNSIYCEDPLPGYPNPEDIRWFRPNEISKETPPEFLLDGAETNDVIQGSLGNCWFIGAMSVLALNDKLIRGGFKPSKENMEEINDLEATEMVKGIYSPIFHWLREFGMYIIRFFKNYKWRYVIIDDELPCYDNGIELELVFGKCRSKNEFWVPLVEKAYAKLHGTYEALISGYSDDGLTDMTGLVSQKLQIKKNNKYNEKELGDKEVFWNKLKLLSENSTLMGCSIKGESIEGTVKIDGEPIGLVSGHAYSLIDCIEANNNKLLRIRNPWGSENPVEWNGAFSDSTPELIKNLEEINKYIKNKWKEEAEEISENAEDGTFLMLFEDFINIWDNLFLCINFPDKYTGIRASCEWNEQNSGGIPNPMNEERLKLFLNNYQFLIKIDNKNSQKTNIFISLGQDDGRVNADSINKFPFDQSINSVILMIFKVDDNTKKLDTFDKNNLIKMTPIKRYREISLDLNLENGSYILVPSTKSPNCFGKFYLNLYYECQASEITVKNLTSSDKFETIEEESEEIAKFSKEFKLLLKEKASKVIY